MGKYFGDTVIITLPVKTMFAIILCHISPFLMVFALVRPGPCNVRLRPRIDGTCALALLPAVRLRHGARSHRIKGEDFFYYQETLIVFSQNKKAVTTVELVNHNHGFFVFWRLLCRLHR